MNLFLFIFWVIRCCVYVPIQLWTVVQSSEVLENVTSRLPAPQLTFGRERESREETSLPSHAACKSSSWLARHVISIASSSLAWLPVLPCSQSASSSDGIVGPCRLLPSQLQHQGILMSTTDGSEVSASGCVQWLVVLNSDGFCVSLMCLWFNWVLCVGVRIHPGHFRCLWYCLGVYSWPCVQQPSVTKCFPSLWF